jgi:site-specific recombinase XerD
VGRKYSLSNGTTLITQGTAFSSVEWRSQTAYAKESDWVFASDKCTGRIPRCASIAARDYLRPAAVEAGVLPKGDTSTRFGWHSLRHSLAEFFADNGVDPAVTMKTLRHKKLSTTLEIYTHLVQNSQIAALPPLDDRFTA